MTTTIDKSNLYLWLENMHTESKLKATEAQSHLIEGVNLGKINLSDTVMTLIHQGEFDSTVENKTTSLVVFEIGLNKLDTQTQTISYSGTLDDYKEEAIKQIESNNQLTLIDIRMTNDKNLVIDYYSKLMEKHIRQYVLKGD